MQTIIFEASPKPKNKKQKEIQKELPKVSEISEIKEVKETLPISPEAQELLTAQLNLINLKRTESKKPTIKVGEVFSTVAYVYERIRNAVDYKGENLLGRNAIERTLNRKLWLTPGENPINVASMLIKELIWARYLPNDGVPEDKIESVSGIIHKYQLFLTAIVQEVKGLKDQNTWRDRIYQLASCEIEEILFPDLLFDDALGNAMYKWFGKNFIIEDQNISDEEKNIQIFIAVHKSLLKADNARVRYRLLRQFNLNWGQNIANIRQDVVLYNLVEEKLNSPILPRLYRYIQKRTAPFQILRDIFKKNKEKTTDILVNEALLSEEIRVVCSQRYSEIQKKVNTGIKRSVIYIFLTKVILAFLVELPYEIIVGGIKLLPLLVNLLLPPYLMFIVGLAVRRPNDSDTEKIIEYIKAFVDEKSPDTIPLRVKIENKKGVLNNAFIMTYSLMSLVIMGIVIAILRQVGFNIVSIGIFFLFMSSVLLFGLRIRYTASEFKMTAEKDHIFSHILSLISLPFLNLGVFFSRTISKYNFLIIIMDFLFEAPLKNIIAVIDDWSTFIRERREEVIEVPQQ